MTYHFYQLPSIAGLLSDKALQQPKQVGKNKVGNCHDSHDDNRAGNDHNSVVNQFFLRRPDDFFSSAFTPRAKLPFASFFLFFCAFFDAVAAI